jgi:hypothetical protein
MMSGPISWLRGYLMVIHKFSLQFWRQFIPAVQWHVVPSFDLFPILHFNFAFCT